ncbi:MAG: AAA family ATPase, partial [Candidatus Acidiferrales bacterium]
MEELGLLLKSRYPLVVVESQEEDRLIALLASLCRELKLAFFTWSVTDGLIRWGQPQPVYQTQEPLKALQHIDSARLPAAYLLRDFHPYLTDPALVRRLREIAQENAPLGVTLVFSSPALQLPTELRPLAAHYTLRLPDETELRQAMMDTFRGLNQNQNFAFRLNEAEQTQLLRNLKGLTLDQAR